MCIRDRDLHSISPSPNAQAPLNLSKVFPISIHVFPCFLTHHHSKIFTISLLSFWWSPLEYLIQSLFFPLSITSPNHVSPPFLIHSAMDFTTSNHLMVSSLEVFCVASQVVYPDSILLLFSYCIQDLYF